MINFSLNYRKGLKAKVITSVQELIISYNKEDVNLLHFCKEYQNKRIVINITNYEDFKTSDGINKIKGIKENLPNLNIVLRVPYSKNICQECKKLEIPFFFSDFFANSWEILNGQIKDGVSDVYIVESLGFDIIKCAEIAHQNNVKIRVFPDIAQSAWDNDKDDIRKFFIRPDDLIQYEPYIDTIEFIGHSVDKQDILCEIYQKQKWAGQLKEIISDFSVDIDNRTILPRFAQNRLNCQKKCLRGSSCNICSVMKEVATTLEKKQVVIKNKKILNLEERSELEK